MSENGEHVVPVNINPFPTLLAQSFALDNMAHERAVGHAQVLAKAAITTVALALECAAYCCLLRIEMSGQLIGRLDRGLSSLDKYDMLHWVATQRPLDRGETHVQQAKELLVLRNDLVHPKVVRKDFAVKKEVQRGDEATFDPGAPELSMLKIPSDEREWEPKHSRAAITAALEFLNYFFVDACKVDVNKLSTMLCTSSGTAAFLTPWEQEMLSLAPGVYGVLVRFINV